MSLGHVSYHDPSNWIGGPAHCCVVRGLVAFRPGRGDSCISIAAQNRRRDAGATHSRSLRTIGQEQNPCYIHSENSRLRQEKIERGRDIGFQILTMNDGIEKTVLQKKLG